MLCVTVGIAPPLAHTVECGNVTTRGVQGTHDETRYGIAMTKLGVA